MFFCFSGCETHQPTPQMTPRNNYRTPTHGFRLPPLTASPPRSCDAWFHHGGKVFLQIFPRGIRRKPSNPWVVKFEGPQGQDFLDTRWTQVSPSVFLLGYWYPKPAKQRFSRNSFKCLKDIEHIFRKWYASIWDSLKIHKNKKTPSREWRVISPTPTSLEVSTCGYTLG